ncbi:MAG: nucleotidyltransferase family protein [Bacteroidales bacterium]|nr:nucleotidyltransferase family protein [Bacteroidales bacterium]
MGFYGKKYKIDSVDVRAFLALTSAGLFGWERFSSSSAAPGINPSSIDWKAVDWDAVMQLAREQALVGIVASAFDAIGLGFELQEVMDRSRRKDLAKKVYSIEQRNLKMESFIGKLFAGLESKGLHPVLLKGQGVAQSYLNPQRRNPGDIDVLLYGDEYESAKSLLSAKAQKVMGEGAKEKQQQIYLGGFIVELHGSLRILLGKKFDTELDRLYKRLFEEKHFRTAIFPGQTDGQESGHPVKLPDINTDVLYVFCHMLHHFFEGGVGLRQVCDLCRLLYCYRNEIDREWLSAELEKLGFMTEWKAFGALMVDYLGMKPQYVPFLVDEGVDEGAKGAGGISRKWRRKARRIMAYILSTGNMGKNRDLSYKKKYPYIIKKLISLMKIISNFWRLARIFPGNAALVSLKGVREGMTDLADGR